MGVGLANVEAGAHSLTQVAEPSDKESERGQYVMMEDDDTVTLSVERTSSRRLQRPATSG